jgi:perosamine synthetase
MALPVPHSRPWIEQADRLALEQVLRSGMLAHGGCVEAFEQAVASRLGAAGGIACTSGTAALVLAFKTLSIGTGDEVVLPTYVCWNVLAAVTACGATPRLCDVDDSGVPTEQTVRAALGLRTRAIVAVHIFGHPCDVAGLARLGLPVIEDACQAFGLDLRDGPAGAAGTLGILSFHATKCLTTGEGGMLVSSDPVLLARARALATSDGKDNAVGATAMSDLQAALGLAQLERYPTFLARRRELLSAYHGAASRLVTASPGYGGLPSFLFRYILRAHQRFDVVQPALLQRGVQARRGVDDLLHRRLKLDDRDFPVAVALFAHTVSLPFHPSLSEAESAHVVSAMQEVFGDA